jgi:hypothetical protein
MLPHPELCRAEGCSRPRTRLSVFCDEHHNEQLRRVGLPGPNPTPPDPCAEYLKKCQRILRWRNEGLITDDELHSQLADVLIDGGVRGHSACWAACLSAMPDAVAAGLLTPLRTSARPHGFFLTSPAKVEAARAVQAELARAANARLGVTDGPA